ncbi:conserved exported protein of unknown function (plasmid) [Cupriavidus neocaledonicus]|uniref:Uncharacterized protein n=1 Tax=Cupriavidus neocaledonicus TaxID=1040979 RepID=A0A375HSC9_9BURK|nr:hypothetical protein; putative exported protein [Cupriavidus neocaledonicus]SPD59784.1 conserved exported protein of unknown function [Cupriavidus neocaledonicus]
MKRMLALGMAVAAMAGTMTQAHAAADVPGEGRVLFQYGE